MVSMYKKYLFVGLNFFIGFSLANNSLFQQFENEYNIGYGYQHGSLINGSYDTSNFDAQSINIEIERLFDAGVWLDGNFNMVTNYDQPNLGPLNGGNGSNVPFGQDPFLFSLTFKVGYAFQVVNQSLQLIPYAMAGRTVNWANSTVLASNGENLANQYFYTGGVGGRLNYRLNSTIMLYMDELYSYNWDNSGAIKSVQSSSNLYGKSYAATNYTITSTLGAKFNLYRNFQVGVNGFWNNYQPQSNISGLIYVPTNTFGTMVSLGLTY